MRSGACALALFGMGFPAMGQTNTPPVAQPRLPNVVLILAEGLGIGDLGSYGQVLIHTPRLDELASGAVRFTEYHTGGATQYDSRATLFSGRMMTNGLSADVPTLGEWMKRAGYHTGFIGQWALGGFDSDQAAYRRGFDEFAGYDSHAHGMDLYTDALYRNDPGTGFNGRVPLMDNAGGMRKVFVPGLLARAATQFIKNNNPEPHTGLQPFFLVLSFPTPQAVFERGMPLPVTHLYADRPWPDSQKLKALTITWLDQHVGDVLNQLQALGLERDTVVIFTSLCGPPADEEYAPAFFKSTRHFTPGQNRVDQGNLQVPLIIRWPFWMKAPKTSDVLCSAEDIVPTLLELARVPAPEGMEGISLLPTLLGQSQANRHEMLQWPVTATCSESAFRVGMWKVMQRGTGAMIEVYDLETDPGEHHDLAAMVPALMRRIIEWPAESMDAAAASGDPASAGGR